MSTGFGSYGLRIRRRDECSPVTGSSAPLLRNAGFEGALCPRIPLWAFTPPVGFAPEASFGLADKALFQA
ncbi:hypothetical protein AFLA_014055 [Aspergillus flavus NRRL3357]|nr:hypothetical protein AFLA_014055 [Aspergillus flavus NRRL3357]